MGHGDIYYEKSKLNLICILIWGSVFEEMCRILYTGTGVFVENSIILLQELAPGGK